MPEIEPDMRFVNFPGFITALVNQPLTSRGKQPFTGDSLAVPDLLKIPQRPRLCKSVYHGIFESLCTLVAQLLTHQQQIMRGAVRGQQPCSNAKKHLTSTVRR